MVEQMQYNFISSRAQELKRRTLERREKRGGLIAAASININQPFPTSPSSMAAVACPRVHLPWPLIPSLLLMVSLPGSHAKMSLAANRARCWEEKQLHLGKSPSSQSSAVCGTTDGAHTLLSALIFITLFLSNRNTPPQLITSAMAPWCILFPPGVGPWIVSYAYHKITVSASRPIPQHYKFIMTSLNLWNMSYYSRPQRTFPFKRLPP